MNNDIPSYLKVRRKEEKKKTEIQVAQCFNNIHPSLPPL